MNTEIIQLSQLVENPDNPRHITERSLQRLITSILVFPKMLSLRPIVVDETMTALGGNMRLRALSAIATFSPEQIAAHLQGSQDYGDEDTSANAARAVMQYPKGSTAQYITWTQAVDNLKFFTEQLRSLFFTQLQLPDWSYDHMSQQALSGESRKQLFIDAQLKVKDEGGRLLEMFDREMNVVKAFARIILGESYAPDIDALQVEHIISPFTINDEKETIDNLTKANGGQPLISHRESIELFGHSRDVDTTLDDIAQQRNTQESISPEPAI